MNPQNQIQQTGWILLTITVVVAILHFAEDVLVPFALAVLLSFLLAPVVEWLQRGRLNRVLSVLLTAVIAFALLGGLVYVVAGQFLSVAEQLPDYRENLRARLKTLRGPLGGGLRETTETVQELTEELNKNAPGKRDAPRIAKVQIVEPPPNAMEVVRGVFGPLIRPLGTAAVVIVFVIFMLLQREDLRDRLIRLIGAKDLHATTLALDDAASRVSRFLLMQTLINGIQGVAVAGGLHLIGVPNAILWGALTIVLRFIPYLGPWLAAAMPIALALAVFDDWTRPLLTIALFVVLELISNNALEPWLYGRRTGISSLALLVATVFWTWLWGIAGLFLAIPLTVCLVVLGKYIPQLEFLSVLLGDEPVLEAKERFYQRLLATDPEEADELIEDALKEKSLIEVCDTIIVPAMGFAEQDHHRGVLDADQRQYIFSHIGELADDLFQAEQEQQAQPAGEPPSRLAVLCLPAADSADEITAKLLARLLELGGIKAEVASVTTLTGEVLELVEKFQPHAICISALPPAAVIHARYLCKRLRNRFSDVPIVVGLWNVHGDIQKAKERLESAGAGKVVTTFADGMKEISQLSQPFARGVAAQAADALMQAQPAHDYLRESAGATPRP